MRKYLTLLLLFSAVLAVPADAVDTLQVHSPNPLLEPWRWTAFDRSSDLASPINKIFEDRDGHLWIATNHGLQRYDGLHWTTYTTEDGLAHNKVYVITQTRDGAMWIGTGGGGLSRFDGQTWTTYTTEDGLASNYVLWGGLHQARNGTLWAGFSKFSDTTSVYGGLSRFDGQTWTTVDGPGETPRLDVKQIVQADDGALWFNTQQGLLRYDGTDWQRYSSRDGLAGDVPNWMLVAADGSLWVTWKQGISHFDGRQWRTYTARDGLPEGVGFITLWQTADRAIWVNHGYGGHSRFDGQQWKTYAAAEIPHFGNASASGLPARDGSVWFFTEGTGGKLLRFDPQHMSTVYSHPDNLFGGFETADGAVWFHTHHLAVRFKDGLWLGYGAADGFIDGEVYALRQTSDGVLWFFGTHQGRAAAARYGQTGWKIYTAADGLVDPMYPEHESALSKWNHEITPLLETRDGTLWFMGQYDGNAAVSRFDGQTWTRYTAADGLVGKFSVRHGYEATDGTLWFGTKRLKEDKGDGLFRFDGQTWTSYTEADGLPSAQIEGFAEWPAGTLWVGTRTGISRLDLTAPVGEASWWNKEMDSSMRWPKVRNFLPTEEALWFGFHPHRRAGICRYDGETWQTYTAKDGLAHAGVNRILRAADGALWAVAQQGISRFNGERWIGYSEEIGAPFGWLFPDMRQMRDGSFWIDGSGGRVVHFHRLPPVPETFIEPTVDKVSPTGNALLEWSGRTLWDDTPPQELRYQWRVDGEEWSPWSRRTHFTFLELAAGKHKFAVRTMDRHGNIDSTPAVHAFAVEALWWKNPWIMGPMVFFFIVSVVQTVRVFAARQRLLDEAKEELQTAYQMQMSLMPTQSPRLEGLEVAGQCLPATEVGGDLFQYFHQEGKFSIALADVTGHAMQAAIPVVMFNGILKTEMQYGHALEDLFDKLNKTLYESLDRRTFICFATAEFDLSTRVLRLSSCGSPYPLHFRAAQEEVVELELDGYPLGVRPDTSYETLEVPLAPGDRVVFCSDGIVEALDAAGEMFGFEQTSETVLQGCCDGLSAAALVARIFEQVQHFSGKAPQEDDQTIVVLQVAPLSE